ncbi:tetratricopeptide repeat protein [Bacillus sp. C1-1]|nr:tetratricopeptide repeat protein [Bacillus sp. C1-1]
MMVSVLSAELVGESLVQWHSCMISGDLQSAKELKSDVEALVKQMEPDDKMLAYYQLIDFRFQLLRNRHEQGASVDEDSLYDVCVEIDDYLRFMYYYVSGQAEFMHGRYKSAIRTYKIAERLIEKVNDSAEKAEFYQKLGISYYRIDQYTFAFSYMEQALEFFEKHDTYRLNEITCKQVLAAINTELRRYDEAERLYDEILKASIPFPYTYALNLYNMGANRIMLTRFDEAIRYFKEALTYEAFATSPLALKAEYYLTHLYMRTGQYKGGLEELEAKAIQHQSKEIVAKCFICRGLYLTDDILLIQQGLRKLESEENYFDCQELGEEIANYFKQQNKFETALLFSEYALEMSRKRIILGVDQT